MTHAELVKSLAAHLWQPSRLLWTGVAKIGRAHV